MPITTQITAEELKDALQQIPEEHTTLSEIAVNNETAHIHSSILLRVLFSRVKDSGIKLNAFIKNNFGYSSFSGILCLKAPFSRFEPNEIRFEINQNIAPIINANKKLIIDDAEAFSDLIVNKLFEMVTEEKISLPDVLTYLYDFPLESTSVRKLLICGRIDVDQALKCDIGIQQSLKPENVLRLLTFGIVGIEELLSADKDLLVALEYPNINRALQQQLFKIGDFPHKANFTAINANLASTQKWADYRFGSITMQDLNAPLPLAAFILSTQANNSNSAAQTGVSAPESKQTATAAPTPFKS